MASVAPARETYRVGDLFVDVGQQRVAGPTGEIMLPKLSFDVFLLLIRRAPDYVSNDQLAATVWQGLVVAPETVTKRVNLLREALGDDAANPRYVAGRRSRGYRIVAPVAPQPVATEQDAAPSTSLQSRTEAAPTAVRSVARARWPIAILALVATAFGWWAWAPERSVPLQSSASPASTPSDSTVAVLKFANLSPEPADDYIAIGLSAMILDRLATVPQLTVIARASAFGLPGESLEPRAAGKALSARYLVDGSVQRDGDHLRVSARLLDTQDGTQVWATRSDSTLAELFAIQDAIALDVTNELRRRIAGLAAPRQASSHQPPIEAQFAFLRGRTLMDRNTVRDSETAARQFAEAVAIDPNFAAALAGQFDALMLAAERRHDDIDVARKRHWPMIERALALDPACGAAYIARALWGASEPARREADFRRGLELDPSNGRGLTEYAEFLHRQGRTEESRSMLDKARLVDPRAPRPYFLQSQWRFKPDGGLSLEAGMQRVLELDPTFLPALQRFAKYRWQHHGKLAEAVQILDRAIAYDPDNPWPRHTAATIYLDLQDEATARTVAEGTPSSRSTASILLAMFDGDWRHAGAAAMSPAGTRYNLYESWGVPEAVRDYALQTGQFAQALEFLRQRYHVGVEDPLELANFRAAMCYAHLLLASGQTAPARKLLERLPPAIDATLAKDGPIYALRTKASVQLLAGDRDAALATLAQSFEANDLSQWWYTLEQDPIWNPLHADPRFVAIDRQVRNRVQQEQAALAEMRRAGRFASGGEAREPVALP